MALGEGNLRVAEGQMVSVPYHTTIETTIHLGGGGI